MGKTGGCMCGGVRFEVTAPVSETGACHCGMWRKASGGIFLGVQVAPEAMILTQDDTLAVYKSSANGMYRLLHPAG